MWEFPNIVRIPLADWTDSFVDWLTVSGQAVFGAVGDVLRLLLSRVEAFMLWLPWIVIVAAMTAIAWRVRDRKLAFGVALGLLFIGTLGLWDEAMMTLALVIVASIVATAVGVPVGLAMGRSNVVERFMRPVLDLMQTMPSFVYLIPALMLFGLGKVPALIATFIYAVPPVIRFTNLGIRQVPADVVEAARSFGTPPGKLLLWVQIPLALPTILAGLNQTIMMAVAMVVIASMIGAGGIGAEVLRGIARLEVGRGFAAGISLVILAVIIDRITQSIANRERATPLP